ncbi:hypothetical protein GQ457_03G018040 [Hibiscus cannabinus]
MNCSFLSWNVRGLRRPEKVRAVAKVLRKSNARVAFIQELKLEVLKLHVYKRWLGRNFGEVEVSISRGASGGLISLWGVNFFVLDRKVVLDRIIILVGQMKQFDLKCGLINVYAPNDPSERKSFFDFLSNFIVALQLPVVMGDDFNTVKMANERMGVTMHIGSLKYYEELIQRNELIDLPKMAATLLCSRGNQDSCKRIGSILGIT